MMMKRNMKLLMLASLLGFVALSAQAVPAKKGVWRMVTLADGTQKRVELRGDEFCSYWVDAEGVSYNLDSESKRYVRVDANALKLRASQLRAKANQDRIARMAKARRMATKKSLGQTNGSYFGKKKGLIILVQYKDKKFKFGHNQKMYNRIANETGYANSLGFVGSVKDYFLAQSNGQFELDFDVVGPYTLNHEYAYYGAPSGNSHDVRPCDMVYDACRLADPDVNFTDYDWDGDGYVEQVYVLFAGLGQAAGGDENTIWPHEYKLQEGNNGSYVSKDNNVVVNTYACGPELTLQYTPVAYRERVDGIGTLCHEFSHCLGYPDLYDTGNGGNFGMGEFDLMDAGSYNGESFCPPNYSAYEKWFAGWITPTVLDKPASVKGMQAQDVKYGQAFVVYNDNNKNEYYLIENRQQNVGIWDKQLPASGMMITHVDYDENIWERNNVNTIVNYSNQYGPEYAYLDNDHQRLTIFHADNEEGSSADSQAGDLYPFNGNNSLTDTSSPAAIIYQGGSTMGKPITNITQNEDGSIDFDFMGCSNDNIISGIHFVENDEAPSFGQGVYSLDGRYMGTSANSLDKGIYIVNGKKIVK
ncbi:M6 family metalloprotease domain-containing protein [Prevotella copri]|uniref:M6 family metalloprotease domain-containing protein n=1 Tax=Segatella copri TaxID=165179 RepID=UPI001C385A87|nr:M6 family metalloprotease domain-containing protein [Segatella copri]MBV3412974.1 M6 family metalloprotease domain-containing protein [Segatella copri]